MACGQNIRTARKLFDNLVLAAIPIAIFSAYNKCEDLRRHLLHKTTQEAQMGMNIPVAVSIMPWEITVMLL